MTRTWKPWSSGGELQPCSVVVFTQRGRYGWATLTLTMWDQYSRVRWTEGQMP